MSKLQTTRAMVSHTGFTLVEMIIVIVVVGVIFAIGGLVLGRAFESYALTRNTTDVDWQGRVAMERMVRELRDARSATMTDLAFTANPMAQAQFIDADGNPVCFFVSGVVLWRSLNGPGSACVTAGGQPLADNIGSGGLAVRFFKKDGTDLVVPPDALAQAYFITVTLNVSEGGINETYRATVQPRGF